MLRFVATTHHIHRLIDNSPSCKKRPVHPSSSLFHQNKKRIWRIGNSFCIWNVSQIITAFFFYVNLHAHNSVFSKIFIRLTATWRLFTVDELEKCIHRSPFYRFPVKHTVCTRQHWVESKKAFTGLVWSVTELVFIKLSCFQ